MHFKNISIFIGFCFLFLGINNEDLIYRRIRQSKNFLEHFLPVLQEPSIEEAIEPDFLENNWENLILGLRINFSEDGYLEIRRAGRKVIIQLFGVLNKSEEKLLLEFLDNLRREGNKQGCTFELFNFLGIALTKEEQATLSILNLTDKEFFVYSNFPLEGLKEFVISMVLFLAKVEELAKIIGIEEIKVGELPPNLEEFLSRLKVVMSKIEEIMEINPLDYPLEEILKSYKIGLEKLIELLEKTEIPYVSGEVFYKLICRELLMEGFK